MLEGFFSSLSNILPSLVQPFLEPQVSLAWFSFGILLWGFLKSKNLFLLTVFYSCVKTCVKLYRRNLIIIILSFFFVLGFAIQWNGSKLFGKISISISFLTLLIIVMSLYSSFSSIIPWKRRQCLREFCVCSYTLFCLNHHEELILIK